MAKLVGWIVVLASLAFVIGIAGRKAYRWWHRDA
jgi:hypothetical protein